MGVETSALYILWKCQFIFDLYLYILLQQSFLVHQSISGYIMKIYSGIIAFFMFFYQSNIEQSNFITFVNLLG